MNLVLATEIVLPGRVEAQGLQVRTRGLRQPTQGHVVLRMDATGVSFAEQQMRLGRYYSQPPFPFVPGYDVVGTVAAGPGMNRQMIGRRYAAVTKVGAWTSHLLIDAADLIAVPDHLDPAAVEAVLVSGITAWQMLHRVAKVDRGGTVTLVDPETRRIGKACLHAVAGQDVRRAARTAPTASRPRVRSAQTVRERGRLPCPTAANCVRRGAATTDGRVRRLSARSRCRSFAIRPHPLHRPVVKTVILHDPMVGRSRGRSRRQNVPTWDG